MELDLHTIRTPICIPKRRGGGGREGRLENEALIFTTKGKKEGELQIKYLVGVGHNVGVVLCERLTGRKNGKYYASIV